LKEKGENVRSTLSLLFIMACCLLCGSNANATEYLVWGNDTLTSGWSVAAANGATITEEPELYDYLVTSSSAHGTIEFTTSTNFSTSGCTELIVNVTNNDSSGSAGDIIIHLYDGTGAEIGTGVHATDYFGATLRQNTPMDMYIPLYRWSSSPMTISKISFEMSAASTMQVAIVQFYDEQMPDPYPLYIYHYSLYSGWTSTNSSGASVDEDNTGSSSFYINPYHIRATYSVANGIVDLDKSSGYVNVNSYDSLAFDMGVSASPDILVALRDENGNIFTDQGSPANEIWQAVKMHCLDGSGSPGTWPSFGCRAQIPFAMLGVGEYGNNTLVSGVAFKSPASGVGNVDISDIRFVNGYSTGGYMQFPLKGSFGSTLMTPYNTEVFAVMDHNDDENISTTGDANSIVAYNGEEGLASNGDQNDSGLHGYKKNGGAQFLLPLLTYRDEHPEVNTNQHTFLFYENGSGSGHRGYDYAHSGIDGADVHAAEYGVLCVATDNTSYDGTNVWRDPSNCKLHDLNNDQWSKYHAVYIIHDKGVWGSDSSTFPNTGDSSRGCFTGNYWRSYISVYLHMSDLDHPSTGFDLRQQIIDHGYAVVKRGQVIGQASDYDTQEIIPPHLHFGFYIGCTPSDPYGPGSGDSNGGIPSTFRVLWEVQPQ
jgi:hypothetical protein